MKSTDKGILFGVVLAALVLGFYLLMLAPKRNEAADLGDEISALETQIDQQEQAAAYAEQARREYPRFYGRLVVLGKAVPEQADTASLLVQLNSTADDADVKFRGITLGTGGTAGSAAEPAAAAPAPAAGSTETPAATDTTATTPSGSTDAAASPTEPAATEAAATPAPATEAAAATLPIGATVGPAGFPTLPYTLDFKGGFFGIADYIGGLDSFVSLRDGTSTVNADGRLITVDGFALSGGAPEPDPELAATFAITTYVTPQQQGLTGGATPTAPSATQPEVTTASAVTP